MIGDVRVYSMGLLCASICVPADQDHERTMAVMNTLHHPGTQLGWQLSDDVTFASGAPMPCPCEQDPTRIHLLLEC